jgi:hypothetical protein
VLTQRISNHTSASRTSQRSVSTIDAPVPPPRVSAATSHHHTRTCRRRTNAAKRANDTPCQLPPLSSLRVHTRDQFACTEHTHVVISASSARSLSMASALLSAARDNASTVTHVCACESVSCHTVSHTPRHAPVSVSVSASARARPPAAAVAGAVPAFTGASAPKTTARGIRRENRSKHCARRTSHTRTRTRSHAHLAQIAPARLQCRRRTASTAATGRSVRCELLERRAQCVSLCQRAREQCVRRLRFL